MSISKKVDVRIYEPQISQLEQLIKHLKLDSSLLETWIEQDKKERENYRNYSGKKPTAKGLILRKALALGLSQLENEIKESSNEQ